MRYRVVHRTRYVYSEPVSSSYGEHHLLPRATPTQQVHESSVAIDPAPDERRERLDLFGNRVESYGLFHEHTELTVTASSLIEVHAPPTPVADAPWEQVRDEVRTSTDAAAIDARSLVLDSPQVSATPDLQVLAHRAFEPGRPIVDAYMGLVSLIFDEFEFDPNATTVTTAIEDVLKSKAGVCQDFSHVLIGCLRSIGLPARYVSGYLETQPPPGQQKLQGADASHAWGALYVPGHGWIDADPTNDQLVGIRHVTVGWGRDYSDVAPLKGVIYTDGPTERLDVAVDVLPLGEPADATPAAG